MNQKWMLKLGTPILAMALMSACGTTNNNNNDNAPQEDNDAPGNENINYDDKPHNNEDFELPDDDVNDNRDGEPNINNGSDNDIPNKIGTHNIKQRKSENDNPDELNDR